MVKLECTGCKYYGPLCSDVDGPKCCNFSWVTGRCRTALPPREDGMCPGYEPGERAKASVKRHDQALRRHTGGRFVKYDPEQLREMYRQGFNDAQIGDAVGAPRGSVRSWRKRNGLPPNAAPGWQRREEVKKDA